MFGTQQNVVVQGISFFMLTGKVYLLKVTLMILIFAVQTVQFCQIITLRCQFLKISYVGGFLTKTPSQTI